ncbi:hypothetical protein ON010_g7543 [Phytophthora cinnamomi]|nr:hypothetical protein ON010_g7543 [Phytophthora cinnamomi]
MFPSFTSLADREHKRIDLLERVRRRVRQNDAKREMYAEASWATDANKTISLDKTSTQDASNQTDGDLKKIPVLVSDQATEAASEPVSDAKAEPATEIPTTTEASTEPSEESKPAYSQEVPEVKSDIDNHFFNDERNQNEAREALIKIFNIYPVLDKLELHPLDGNARQLTKYIIRSGAKIYTKAKKHVIVPSIDWDETYYSIQAVINTDPRFIKYIANLKMAKSTLFPEYQDVEPLKVWESLIGRKRKLSSTRNNDRSTPIKQRLENSFIVNSSTSSTNDEEDNKRTMIWTIFANKGLIEEAGLSKSIVPVLIEHNIKSPPPIDTDGYVWLHNSSVAVFGKQSSRLKPAITEKVSWGSTLREFIELIRSKGYDVESVGNTGKQLSVKEFKNAEGEARHGTMTGNDSDMDPTLTNADNDAKRILTHYYKGLLDKGVGIAFELHPVVQSKNGIKVKQEYYFSNPTAQRIFNIKSISDSPDVADKPLKGDAFSYLIKTIQWMDTFTSLMEGFQQLDAYLHDREGAHMTADEKKAQVDLRQNLSILDQALQSLTKSTGATSRVKQQSIESVDEAHNPQMISLRKLHDESESAFQNYGEAMRKYEEAKEAAKSSRSKAVKSNLKAATAAMKATKAIFQAKSKKYVEANRKHDPNYDINEFNTKHEVKRTIKSMVSKLEGRGLRGAGMKPLEGVKRKTNQTYNLNDIQGLATPSAYIYRKLGSKFIRLPDLDKRTLTIVQPNRKKVGPMREISDALQVMIKDLVFRNDISQEKYDNLSIDDKKLFKEILEMTHLQYNFDQHLEDPLESLKMEYDKLKGELMLVLDPKNISKSAGLYNLDADHNLTELKSIMKDLLVKEVPSRDRPSVWASDSKPYSKKTVSTQTDASGEEWEKHSDKAGSGVWAYKKRKKNVRTFAL